MSSAIDLVQEVPSRGRQRRAVAGVAVVAIAAVVATVSLVRSRSDTHDVVASPNRKSAPVLVVVGTQVLDVDASPPEVVVELPADAGWATKAVMTAHGLVVAMERPLLSQLLLVPVDGSPARLIARDPSGFAVDATGSRLAWAITKADDSEAELFEAALEDLGATHSAKLDRNATVVGYAGRLVVLSTGRDPWGHNAPPERTSAALWDPSGGVTFLASRDGPYWFAVGTDPSAAVAVLAEGNGECRAIVELPSMRRRNDAPDCEGIPFMASFSPDGRWLAAARADASDALELLTSDGTFVAAGPSVEGPAVWIDDATFVALAYGGSHVERCDVKEGRSPLKCTTVWRFVPPKGVILDGPIVLVATARTG